MNIEQLQRFLVVADCLNFTTAAERLYVGQSTISRQVAALEQEFGVVLLIRGPRSVELTEAGKLLQTEGNKLMRYLEQLKKRVANAGSGAVGRLRFSTVPAYFPILNELCAKTMEIYPDLELELNYSKYVNVCQDLDLGAADFGVFYSFLDPRDDAYECIPLQDEHFVVLCGKKHWVARHPDGIYLDDLRDENICFGRSSVQMIHSPQSYKGGDPPIAERANFSSMESTLMNLQTDGSVMLLPTASAKANANNLAAIPLLDEDLRHKVVLTYRKDSVTNSMKCFLNIVNSYLNGVLE